MGSDWQRYLFEDCMDAIIDYRGKTPKKTNTGIPLITAKIIKNGTIQPVNEFIAESDYDSWMRRGIPEPGDVVLTTEAPLGEVAQLDSRKIALAQRVITLRGKKGFLDNTFLKYLLLSSDVQHQLDSRGTGTTVKGIKQSELRKLELPIPEYKTQRYIAHVIGSLDNKIELNRQTNQTLEQMAQALFKSWFVDFDPVIDKALAAGNPIPDELQDRAQRRQQQLAKPDHKPLPDDILQLFPSEFELTDELGWVPLGWGIRSLYSCADYINGAAYKKFEPNDQKCGLPIIKIAELKSGLTENTGFSTVEMPEKYLIREGDLLFSWSGNPDTSIDTFVWSSGDAWLNQHIFRVLPYKDTSYGYLLALLRYLKPVFAEIARDKQTTGLGHVTVKDLKRLMIAAPSVDIMMKADELLSPFNEQSLSRQKSTHSLANLRDLLLPKLISGELRLPAKAVCDEDQKLT